MAVTKINGPYSPFGLALQGHRRTRGLTQAVAAVKAGISQDFFSDVETGRRHPSRKVLHAIAQSFNLTDAESAELERLLNESKQAKLDASRNGDG